MQCAKFSTNKTVFGLAVLKIYVIFVASAVQW